MLAYQRFWNKHPPADLLIASFMGYKGEADEPAPDPTLTPLERSIEKLAQLMGVPLPPAKDENV